MHLCITASDAGADEDDARGGKDERSESCILTPSSPPVTPSHFLPRLPVIEISFSDGHSLPRERGKGLQCEKKKTPRFEKQVHVGVCAAPPATPGVRLEHD